MIYTLIPQCVCGRGGGGRYDFPTFRGQGLVEFGKMMIKPSTLDSVKKDLERTEFP